MIVGKIYFHTEGMEINMTINLFWLCAIGIIAAMAGFWSGRWSTFMQFAGDENLPEVKVQAAEVKDAEGVSAEERIQITENQSVRQVQEAERMQVIETSNARDTQGIEKMQNIEKREKDRVSNTEVLRGRRNECNQFTEKKGNEIGRFGLLRGRRKGSNNEKRIPLGWAIGSPAEGAVYTFNDGRRKGAMVRTTQGCLYAPVSGKIVKLYPMGNQMILRTDFGVELLLRVGGVIDEMTGEYFRPRILQNEIVNKGKLLLEYDREGLIAEGEDTDIYISVEVAEDYRNITVTEKAQVKLGEEILWVMDHSRIVTN